MKSDQNTVSFYLSDTLEKAKQKLFANYCVYLS